MSLTRPSHEWGLIKIIQITGNNTWTLFIVSVITLISLISISRTDTDLRGIFTQYGWKITWSRMYDDLLLQSEEESWKRLRKTEVCCCTTREVWNQMVCIVPSYLSDERLKMHGRRQGFGQWVLRSQNQHRCSIVGNTFW
jgi:hypothetical protein